MIAHCHFKRAEDSDHAVLTVAGVDRLHRGKVKAYVDGDASGDQVVAAGVLYRGYEPRLILHVDDPRLIALQRPRLDSARTLSMNLHRTSRFAASMLCNVVTALDVPSPMLVSSTIGGSFSMRPLTASFLHNRGRLSGALDLHWEERTRHLPGRG